jgi:uncharacterized protein
MRHKHGESREQVTLFPIMLNELVGSDSLVRVIDAWVEALDLKALGFEKAQASSMGRPSYAPADLLKLHLCGYLNLHSLFKRRFFLDNRYMILLLSPAKSLDYETPAPSGLTAHKPVFMGPAGQLIEILKTKTPAQIATLMDLSDKLAALNVARFQAWRPSATAKNAKQAILAFDGDVYDGLNAKKLTAEQLLWADEHLCILSGLYGALRPLDLLQPYRLEMGTKLPNANGKNLYEFWGDTVSNHINKLQKADKEPVVINLASQEYFKVVNKKALKAKVIECVFEEHKNGAYKVISFMAKRARGMMARFAIEQQITEPEGLKLFKVDHYAFAKAASSADRWVFRRKIAA